MPLVLSTAGDLTAVAAIAGAVLVAVGLLASYLSRKQDKQEGRLQQRFTDIDGKLSQMASRTEANQSALRRDVSALDQKVDDLSSRVFKMQGWLDRGGRGA